jgi:hypothetical protein
MPLHISLHSLYLILVWDHCDYYHGSSRLYPLQANGGGKHHERACHEGRQCKAGRRQPLGKDISNLIMGRYDNQLQYA